MHVKGIRRKFVRSEKPTVQKRIVKKDELNEEQMAILKYLEMDLDGEDKKRH